MSKSLSSLLLLSILVTTFTLPNFIKKTVQSNTHGSSPQIVLLSELPSSYHYDDNDNVRGPKRGAGRQDR